MEDFKTNLERVLGNIEKISRNLSNDFQNVFKYLEHGLEISEQDQMSMGRHINTLLSNRPEVIHTKGFDSISYLRDHIHNLRVVMDGFNRDYRNALVEQQELLKDILGFYLLRKVGIVEVITVKGELDKVRNLIISFDKTEHLSTVVEFNELLELNTYYEKQLGLTRV